MDAQRSSFPRRAAAAGTAVLVLSACRLIDQRTFAPAPGPPAKVAATLPAETRTPLLTVAPGTNLANYRGLLRATAHAAEERDSAVRFDVVAVVPATGTLAAQVTASEAARGEATHVARELIDAGVTAGRVELKTTTDPHVSRADVRVYVR